MFIIKLTTTEYTLHTKAQKFIYYLEFDSLHIKLIAPIYMYIYMYIHHIHVHVHPVITM